MIALENILLIGSLLILVSIAVAKLSDNLGLPSLLLFLGIGMLAGSEGPGGIYFDDAALAQAVGIMALVIILFAGGLDTSWREVRPVFAYATSLATLGVLITALSVGLFASYVLGLSLLNGLLLGAIVSSTDAAAVFSVLRSKNVHLGSRIKAMLELESGSNDPMAVFLTIGLVQILTDQERSFGSILFLFPLQMGLGVLAGWGSGKGLAFTLNRLKLSAGGLYPVFCLAGVALIYSVTTVIGGSGFLAVYVAGLTAGNSEFVQKRSLLRFFDGFAWLGQITMFLTLGLLVFPSHIVPVVGSGLLVSAFLMLIARPLSVGISLAPGRMTFRELVFVSWVGLRGAVPIILATFPLLAGLPEAEMIFNVVFFIVLTSALLQGWSIPAAARLLKVESPPQPPRDYPIEFASLKAGKTELVDLIIPYNSTVAGKAVVEVGLPKDTLIVLIGRGDDFIVPSGGTVLQEGDTLLVLVSKETVGPVRDVLSALRRPE
jgi:cell volume regulation protein A